MRKVVPWPGSLSNLDVAAALLDDPVHGGQAQAGALALLLGGEERFEDLRLDLTRDAGTGIGDREHDVGPRSAPPRAAARTRRRVHVRGFEDDAAPGHRVPRVDARFMTTCST